MKKNIGMIGCGNMGSAILAGIHKQFSLSVCEQDKRQAGKIRKRYGVQTVDLDRILKKSSVIILAIKPQGFDRLLKEMRPLITDKHLIVSIAAGITTKYIEKALDNQGRVVRTMPNLPSQVGLGMTGISKGKKAKVKDVLEVKDIFKQVGEVAVVEEELLDALTAVSGSGPAYLFYFVECLEQAAKSVGFKKDLSRKLILQTLKGSLTLLESQKDDAGVLRGRVTSKGGTTEAALKVFKKNKTDKIITNAVKAATKRSKELSR